MEIPSDLKVSNLYIQTSAMQEIAGTLRNLEKEISKLHQRMDMIELKVYNKLEHDVNIDNNSKFMNIIDERLSKLPNFKPQLTLMGSSVVYIPLNSIFKDPFVTVHDPIDKLIHKKITVKGFVDVSKVNNYTLIYSVSNDFGYSSFVSRTVIVHTFPTTMPQLKSSTHSLSYIVYSNDTQNTENLSHIGSRANVTNYDINQHVMSLNVEYKVLKYTDFTNNVIKLKSLINTILYDKLHLNVWSSNVNSLLIKVGQTNKTINFSELNKWVAIDLDLNSEENIDTISFINLLSTQGVLYIDDVYFYKYQEIPNDLTFETLVEGNIDN